MKWLVGLATLLVSLGVCAGTGSSGMSLPLQLSRDAIGNELPELVAVDARGRSVNLSELNGKPVIVSLIFTGCVHACSVATSHLNRMVRQARSSLGEDSFYVLTIGFDQPVDSPEAMRVYAQRHGVNDSYWHFLSLDSAGDVQRVVDAVGFYYEPSPRGYDHTVKISLFDRNGVLRHHVYGETFSIPLMMEPLKRLVLGELPEGAGIVERVGSRIRLFCTAYDPKADRYYFDYSLFVGILISTVVLGLVLIFLIKEFRGRRQSRMAH